SSQPRALEPQPATLRGVHGEGHRAWRTTAGARTAGTRGTSKTRQRPMKKMKPTMPPGRLIPVTRPVPPPMRTRATHPATQTKRTSEHGEDEEHERPVRQRAQLADLAQRRLP